MEDFKKQVSELDRQLSLRTRELDVIRAELKAVKDFRRKRAQMQRELDEVHTGWPQKNVPNFAYYNCAYTLWREISFCTFVDQYALLLTTKFQ